MVSVKHISIVLLLLVLVTIVFTIVYTYKLCQTSTYITYIDENYFRNIVNTSDYFMHMNMYDLTVRGADSQHAYIQKYTSGYREFTKEQKNVLQKCVDIANERLKKAYPLLYSIPWKLVKLDVSIENGFPHTLGDVIILSDAFFSRPIEDMTVTLIHEKVHVFQRKHPDLTEQIIKQMGFKRYDIQKERLPYRNNPDLPHQCYGNHEGPIVQVYDSNPRTLAHSRPKLITSTSDMKTKDVHPGDIGVPPYVHQIEHPYEIMASIVPELIMDRQRPSTEVEKAIYNSMLV